MRTGIRYLNIDTEERKVLADGGTIERTGMTWAPVKGEAHDAIVWHPNAGHGEELKYEVIEREKYQKGKGPIRPHMRWRFTIREVA